MQENQYVMKKKPQDFTSQRTTKARSVTIKDLSAELGLSITTISRALNGYSDVGEKTRKRVEEVARAQGYRPNRNAQRLVTQRTHNIAWVQSDNDRKFVDPHFVEVMAGVLRGARAGGYDIVLTSDTPDHQISVYDRYVKDNSVDGFIVDLPVANDPRISFLMETQKPFVVHGRDERADEYSWIDIDNHGNFYDLTRLMIANGHKRIAFVNGEENLGFSIARRQGVERAVATMGMLPETVRILSTVHPMSDAGFQLTEQALKDRDVTAILYSSALMAVEGHAAIVRAGRSVGVDMAVGTMDDELNYLDLSPFKGQFTFVRSSLSEAGEVLVRQLIEICEKPSAPRGTTISSSFHIADGLDGAILGKKI